MVYRIERGFEYVARYRNDRPKYLVLPSRKTKFSAGYDFVTPEKITLYPGEEAKILTGVKAFMLPDEYLALHIRSSLAIKKNLMLKNCTGIIDSDYYNNQDNEGEIIGCIKNIGEDPVTIEAGDAFMQGIFCKYMLVSDDLAAGKISRVGGIGSTSNS